MADVRLTATNPADSSVVPVACNERGELLLEEPREIEGPEGPQGPQGPTGPPGPPFNGQLNGNLDVQGTGSFTHTVTRSGRENIPSFVSQQGSSNVFGPHYQAFNDGSTDPCFSVFHNGSALFADGAITFNVNGSADFAGDVSAGPDFDNVYINAGSADGSRPCKLEVNGMANTGQNKIAFEVSSYDVGGGGKQVNYSLNYGGTAAFNAAILNLEPDNDDNYTVTTEEYIETEAYTGPLGNTLEREVAKTREIRTYTGPTLDVKEAIQELQQREADRDQIIADLAARFAAWSEKNAIRPGPEESSQDEPETTQ